MSGAWSWNLAVTDRSELAGAGGERKLCCCRRRLVLINWIELPPAVARERRTLRFWREEKLDRCDSAGEDDRELGKTVSVDTMAIAGECRERKEIVI